MSSPFDGIVVDWPDLRIVDTRELPWEPLPGIPGAVRKVLAAPGGVPTVLLVYLPPGSPLPDLPDRHRHRTLRERSFTLWGELPHWEYRDATQQHGDFCVRRAGYFMHRQPGSIHGLEPGATSPIGWCAIQWRDRPGNWVGEPEFATETEDVPYEDGWQQRETGETLPDDRGVVFDWDDLTLVDTRELPWEERPGAAGNVVKVLDRDADGYVSTQLVFFPAGFTLPNLPARLLHRTVTEWSFSLWGEFPHWEYESAEQQRGLNSDRRDGFFMFRLPGSVHGIEDGPVSPVGWASIVWRSGPNTWMGEPDFATETVPVPYART